MISLFCLLLATVLNLLVVLELVPLLPWLPVAMMFVIVAVGIRYGKVVSSNIPRNP